MINYLLHRQNYKILVKNFKNKFFIVNKKIVFLIYKLISRLVLPYFGQRPI
jgi:hypothetical protein